MGLKEFEPLDLLSSTTRGQRKNLLIASGVAVAVANVGLVPKEISFVGVRFGSSEQDNLRWALAVLVAFFLLAFVAYAWRDFRYWRLLFGEGRRGLLHGGIKMRFDLLRLDIERGKYLAAQALDPGGEEEEKSLAEFTQRSKELRAAAADYAFTKGLRRSEVGVVLMEFVVPLAIGIYSIFALVVDI
jgi:hypothetical protein